MTKLAFLLGGWIALNVLLAVGLLSRRSNPELRERLFRWVIGNPGRSRRRKLAYWDGHRSRHH
jgi:hypothetical protein